MVPSSVLSAGPSAMPSAQPSSMPSAVQSSMPSAVPSLTPSLTPSRSPSAFPSSGPSSNPSSYQSALPSFTPPQLLSWYIDRVSNGTITTDKDTGYSELTVYYNMTNRNYSFAVLDSTCNKTNTVTGVIVERTSSNSSEADGFMNIATDLSFNTTEIENDDDLWVGNDARGYINFCLVASLWSDDDIDGTPGKMITFDETIFTIDVDKTSNVTFLLGDINIIRVGADSVDGPDIDYDATLKAYQCDSFLEEISTQPLSQKNNILSMCVHSTSNIKVSSFATLVLTQESAGSFPEYNYYAINDGIPENTALVAQSTPAENRLGNKVVRVQVVLAALLFASPNPAAIEVSGTVMLDVAGSTDRHTRHLKIDFEPLLSSDSINSENDVGRLLQDNDTTDTFDLTVELVGNDSASGLSTTPAVFSTMAGGAVLAGIVFAQENIL